MACDLFGDVLSEVASVDVIGHARDDDSRRRRDEERWHLGRKPIPHGQDRIL